MRMLGGGGQTCPRSSCGSVLWKLAAEDLSPLLLWYALVDALNSMFPQSFLWPSTLNALSLGCTPTCKARENGKKRK